MAIDIEDGLTLRASLAQLRQAMAGVDYLPGGVGPRVTLDDGRQLWVRLKHAQGGGSLLGVWVAELRARNGETQWTYDL